MIQTATAQYQDKQLKRPFALHSTKAGPLAQETQIKIATRGLNFYYDDQQALFDNNLEIAANQVTAIIGPSGCGKSTHLRTYNRIFELYRGQRVSGEVLLDGQNILDSSCDVLELRRKVGMIFQKPTPFPMSVFDNIAYGLKQHYHINRSELRDRVEKALQQAALWDEVKDRLKDSALGLSGGQQQRLVIARAIALKPELIIADEPTSALDPISTAKVEELVSELKKEYTVAIVTHNMQQAARVSDFTAYMYLGELMEFGVTEQIFLKPSRQETEDYITGRFG